MLAGSTQQNPITKCFTNMYMATATMDIPVYLKISGKINNQDVSATSSTQTIHICKDDDFCKQKGMGTHCSSTGNNLVKCGNPSDYPSNICLIQQGTPAPCSGSTPICKETKSGSAYCDSTSGDDGGLSPMIIKNCGIDGC